MRLKYVTERHSTRMAIVRRALWVPLLIWELPTLVWSQQPQQTVCSQLMEFKNHENADFVIGGMFPVHFLSNNIFVYNSAGQTWIQAMLFSLEEINNSTTLLPGVKLGFTIYDSCNEISIALQSSLNMVRQVDALPALVPGHQESNISCNCARRNVSVIGLVGDASSKTTIKVASVAAATNTPQISYSATSTDLSARNHYPTFMRTIPPDNFQAKFIVDILRHFQWKYVNILASDDDYGRIGINELIPELKSYNICVAIQEIYDIAQDARRTSSVVARLKMEDKAKVIVLWGQIAEARVIFQESQRQGLFYRTWIATEAFGSSPTLTSAFDPRVVQGLLGIIPAQATHQPFFDYLRRAFPNSSNANPWLEEYWVSKASCKIVPGSEPAKYNCPDRDTNLSVLPLSKYLNVIDAVYALAHALHNMIAAVGVDEAKKELVEGSLYLDFVKNVRFQGKLANVSFDSQGNPSIALYSLTNLQAREGLLAFVPVATYDSHSRKIIVTRDIQFANKSWIKPNSTCAELCSPGSYGLRFQDKPCCWQCVTCKTGTAQPLPGQDFCYRCPGNARPNFNQTACVEPEMDFYKLASPSGIALVILTLSTCFAIISGTAIFQFRRSTPVVKALNPNLSYLQLASMLGALAMPGIFVLHRPTNILCGLSLFHFVCFHSVTITVVFMKADRLLRIFKASQAGVLTKGSILKSNRVQFITVALLTFIGLAICTILYSVFQPQIEEDVDFANTLIVMYHCGGNYDTILMILLGYVFIISVACAVYAFLARKLPEDYNEAKYISFAMFTSCLGWIMFVPLYFSRARARRTEVLCYVSYISITAIFLLMYLPKIRIIVFHPELNTKQVFRDKMKERQFSQAQAKKYSTSDGVLHSSSQQAIALHTPSNSRPESPTIRAQSSNRNPGFTIL